MTSELDLQARDHGDKLLEDIGRIYRAHLLQWTQTGKVDTDALALEIQWAVDPYIQNTKPAATEVKPTITTMPVDKRRKLHAIVPVVPLDEDEDIFDPSEDAVIITYSPADDAEIGWAE